ncbi:MAG: aldehyde ferredoxin oxidoreductase family protein [Dehalococcoidia bacterium]
MLTKAINGKILSVNLSSGASEPEFLPEDMYRRYIGGYGLGVRLLFGRIPQGADALGPNNILGLFPGILTGTPLFGSRYTVVGKTPKNGGWGDANSGGDFGPVLKCAGWDGLLFSGVADQPVYLLIEDDKVEIKDASDLWGLSAITTEARLKKRHGKKASIACIGQAGENLSYMAGVCNERGRLAARSGLGAVMGSKKLKAVVVCSSRGLLASDDKAIRALVRASVNELGPMANFFRDFGTTGITARSAVTGDSPVKNWGGAGSVDFPTADELAGDKFNAKMEKRYACWRCPIACGAESKISENPLFPYPKGTHRAEYETACAFGTMTLTADIDFLQYANHLCNAYGLDTISAGATVAFAVECYENGIITKEDTDGLELTWGNARAMIALLDRIGKREGVGELFADGIRKAADALGDKSEPFAMEIGGEELPMHDAKLQPEYFATYKLDPTPARHTQYPSFIAPAWGVPLAPRERGQASGRAEHHKGISEYHHIVNSMGTCMFITFTGPNQRIPEWINAVTGWDTTHQELLKTGERIANLRMAFHVRDGDNPAQRRVPGRLVGNPPLAEGPHAGFTLDTETLQREFLAACDWDQQTCKPSRAKLEELGLADVAAVLHG